MTVAKQLTHVPMALLVNLILFGNTFKANWSTILRSVLPIMPLSTYTQRGRWREGEGRGLEVGRGSREKRDGEREMEWAKWPGMRDGEG